MTRAFGKIERTSYSFKRKHNMLVEDVTGIDMMLAFWSTYAERLRFIEYKILHVFKCQSRRYIEAHMVKSENVYEYLYWPFDFMALDTGTYGFVSYRG